MLDRKTPIVRRTPLKRSAKRIPRIRPERAKQVRAYSVAQKRYLLEHPICEVWCAENGWQWISPGKYERDLVECPAEHLFALSFPRSTQVHHMNKRRGVMLLDENFWLAVCRENHDRIEQNKSWAREQGFLCNF